MLLVKYAKSAVEPSKEYRGEVEKSGGEHLTLKLAEQKDGKDQFRTLKRAKILAIEIVK